MQSAESRSEVPKAAETRRTGGIPVFPFLRETDMKPIFDSLLERLTGLKDQVRDLAADGAEVLDGAATLTDAISKTIREVAEFLRTPKAAGTTTEELTAQHAKLRELQAELFEMEHADFVATNTTTGPGWKMALLKLLLRLVESMLPAGE